MEFRSRWAFNTTGDQTSTRQTELTFASNFADTPVVLNVAFPTPICTHSRVHCLTNLSFNKTLLVNHQLHTNCKCSSAPHTHTSYPLQNTLCPRTMRVRNYLNYIIYTDEYTIPVIGRIRCILIRKMFSAGQMSSHRNLLLLMLQFSAERKVWAITPNTSHHQPLHWSKNKPL